MDLKYEKYKQNSPRLCFSIISNVSAFMCVLYFTALFVFTGQERKVTHN